jgi:hypothetical protein
MRAAAGLAAAMQAGRLFAGDGAATQGELVVHYQPVFQTGSQQITAVDVFVRSERGGGPRPPHAHDRPGDGRDEPSSRDRQLRVRVAVAISEPRIYRWATSIGARGAGWIRPRHRPAGTATQHHTCGSSQDLTNISKST